MTLEILAYCPKPGYSIASEPRRKVNQFGDGYQQRQVDGLNPLLREYQLTFNLNHRQAKQFEQFLIKKGGVTAFLFREKPKENLIKVVCPKWGQIVGKTHIEFNCTFEEVV
ncbi:phage tail protein [Volucribacter amazonae]|uniref:Phage tail protein n=1 Tax=Volucribacter amazonae TaxID=256731 RepID=A0A9X4PC32_9PAST|nr:phage tail protein [Volucribacter amazonae]MDG6894514.1 phage tail protein [Volucribacter amazonae]